MSDSTTNQPQAPTSPEQKPKRRTALIVGSIITIIVIVIIGSFLYLQYGQPKEYELTIVRATFIVNVGTTNATSVIVQDKVAGKYSVGSDLLITFPFYNTYGTGTLRLVSVSSQTQGFSFRYSDPVLPVTAPSSGSTVVTLRFATPTTSYKGPLDYTVYFNYQN